MFSEIERQAAALNKKLSRRKLQGFYQQDRQRIETSSEPAFRTASGNVENLYAVYRFLAICTTASVCLTHPLAAGTDNTYCAQLCYGCSRT